ncbi:PhzF family phenazine biosynthesis protein [Paenibacillus woosongensis]|uniref:Phenazine biosynthesis protein n=1 Tax=Paenibacillus woosongensis TaxID=307580 RepID=A0ABQ4MM51_9BACL|nr:PhzF family phenazine biosynthesis protein [Paenibacillus woosongensis]GIP57062.1 phenazine biosynthesis protein [Paenibacillus woosongensis]
MAQDVHTYKVFTDDASQGNAAAVIEYGGWSDAELLELARRSGAPVTVFVQFGSAQERDAVLRYFSTEKEMTFCGHGTLAAGAYMIQQCQLDRLQVITGSGTPIVITKSPQGHYYFKTERARRLDMIPDLIEIAHMLGVEPGDISEQAPFGAASIGSPKLLVPLCHLTHLDAMAPKFEEIEEWSRRHRVNGVYAYAIQQTKEEAKDAGALYVHARGFNPLFGILEDAATGVAAGALGDLLFQEGGPSKYVFVQGKHVGAESEIRVMVTAESVEIGGSVLHL